MWGCFQFVHPSWRLLPVFPTHVGVFPTCSVAMENGGSLPHACGGNFQAVQPTNAAPSMLSAISSKNCGTGRPRERRIWKSPFKPSRHRESSSAVMREVRRVGGMASSLARSGVPGGGRGLPSGMGGAAGAPSLAPCPPCRTVAHLPASVRALSSPSAGGKEEAPPASKSSHRRPCSQFSAYMRILPFTLAANSSCSAAAALAARMITGTNSGALRVAASHISAASAFPRR